MGVEVGARVGSVNGARVGSISGVEVGVGVGVAICRANGCTARGAQASRQGSSATVIAIKILTASSAVLPVVPGGTDRASQEWSVPESELQQSSEPRKEGCRACVAPCPALGFLTPFVGLALVVLVLGPVDSVEKSVAVLTYLTSIFDLCTIILQ